MIAATSAIHRRGVPRGNAAPLDRRGRTDVPAIQTRDHVVVEDLGGDARAAMKVLVCGGRDFADRALLEATLDRLHHARVFTALIEGDAHGADRMAGEWAEAQGIAHQVFKADWDALGAKA